MRTLAALSLLGAVAALPAAEPKKHALLIAVSEYNHSAFNRNRLQYPFEDAKALAEALEPHGYTVDLLLGAEATQRNVRERLKGLAGRGNDAGALVVGVFGHGMEPAESATSYFCPYDAGVRVARDDKGNALFDGAAERLEPDPATLVSATELIRAMRVSPAGNRVLLADCCRDDESRARKRAFGKEFTVDMLPNNTAVLLACEAGQTARESSVWRHGAFSKALLEAIQAEAGRGGAGSLRTMADAVDNRTAALVRKVAPGEQQTLGSLLKGKALLLVKRSVRPRREKMPFPHVPTSGQRSRQAGESLHFDGTPFRYVPPGPFLMGSPTGEPKRMPFEKQVRVTIGRGF